MSDERLQKALEFSNYIATITNQKQQIKNRVAQLQLVHANGGTFRANQETIAFVKTLLDMDHKSAILLDSKDNPINVTDVKDLLEQLVSAYFSAMQEYDAEYTKIKKSRSVEKIMDW